MASLKGLIEELEIIVVENDPNGIIERMAVLLMKAREDIDYLLDRAAELPLERNAQQNCPDCGGSGYLVDEEGNEHQCLLCL